MEALFRLSLIAFIATSRWWIVVLFGVVALLVVLLAVTLYVVELVDSQHEKLAALIARADQQHAWVLAGDDRGFYGEYTPAALFPGGTGMGISVPQGWSRQTPSGVRSL